MSLHRLVKVLGSLKRNPGFVLMRGVARFRLVRKSVRAIRHYLHKTRWQAYKEKMRERLHESVFPGLDPVDFTAKLKCNGVAFGLKLPEGLVQTFRNYAEQEICYADREPEKGFALNMKSMAEQAISKPILVAQYFNTEKTCEEITRLRRDPFLLLVAAEYLGSVPKYVGTNLWWTFPVDASPEDRSRHAHVFHQDLDDYAFVKIFFYLTDMEHGDGVHVCVAGSHIQAPMTRLVDRLLVRRWSEDEIYRIYGKDRILEIAGPKGTGFAEDTYCIHKGTTPIVHPRPLLQLQYALFDHGVQSDEVAPVRLLKIQ